MVPPSMSQSTRITERDSARVQATLTAQYVDVWPALVVHAATKLLTDQRPSPGWGPSTARRTVREWHRSRSTEDLRSARRVPFEPRAKARSTRLSPPRMPRPALGREP